MRQTFVKAAKRNGAVCGLFVLLLVAFRVLPPAWEPHPLLIASAFFAALLWANHFLLIQLSKPERIFGVILSLVLVPVLGFPTLIASVLLTRQVAECRYNAQGFTMVNGCNGSAANLAEGEIHQFEEFKKSVTESTNVTPGMLTNLEKGYALAQEKAKILNYDCAMRGHCETHPWKTNWAAIKPILEIAQNQLFQ